MPQLSLYLDDETMETLRRDAKEAGLSLSKYTANLIKGKSEHKGWPEGYWETVYGCMADDDSMARAIEELDTWLDPSLDDACDWFK